MNDKELIVLAAKAVVDPESRAAFNKVAGEVTAETVRLAHETLRWEHEAGPAAQIVGYQRVRSEALDLLGQARAANENNRHREPPPSSRMSGVEVRARREALGLERSHLGSIFGVQQETVKDWERGRLPVPYRVRMQMVAVERETIETIEDLTSLVDQADKDEGHEDSWWTPVIDRAQPAVRAYGIRWWRTCCVKAWGEREIPAAVMTPPDYWAPLT